MVDLEKPIENLLDFARSKGVSLAELQSEIRTKWRAIFQKNEGR